MYKSKQFQVLGIAIIALSGCASPWGGLANLDPMKTTDAVMPSVGQTEEAAVRPDLASAKTADDSRFGRVANLTDAPERSGVEPVAFNRSECVNPSVCGPMDTCGPSANCACPSCEVVPHGYALPMMPVRPAVDPQEFICDGGDQPPLARVLRDDSIAGVQLEDTVVAYSIGDNRAEVQPSNRVCLYAPRFQSVRQVTGAAVNQRDVGPSGFAKPTGPGRFEVLDGGVLLDRSQGLAHAEVTRGPDAFRRRERGVIGENVLQLEQASLVQAALANIRLDATYLFQEEERAMLQELAQAAIAWTLDESVEVEINGVKPPTLTRDQSVEEVKIYEFPDAGRLRILKMADRFDAAPGEVINFALQVQNVGDSPVNDIVITDNLTTRLAYIDGSQTASVGAEFSTRENEGLSLQLTWRLTDDLAVGETAVLRFRCRLR
ncbi:MAG: DUF11 domain-containing protein [Planctomycetota bacterium]